MTPPNLFDHSKASLRQLATLQSTVLPIVDELRGEWRRSDAPLSDERHEELEGQRLAERFARRPVEPVHVPERPMTSGLAPYIAAAGLFVFAGAGAALYLLQDGDETRWNMTGAARAAVASSPSIDSTVALAPASKPMATEALSDDDEADAKESWAQTLDSFRSLTAAKPAAGEAKSATAGAKQMLKAMEGWKKSGN
jgi:hypothetical protein